MTSEEEKLDNSMEIGVIKRTEEVNELLVSLVYQMSKCRLIIQEFLDDLYNHIDKTEPTAMRENERHNIEQLANYFFHIYEKALGFDEITQDETVRKKLEELLIIADDARKKGE